MKIGILTFHWATNYGAVLQTYCLQSYLETLGHEVHIINYKPKEYDFSVYWYIRRPQRLINLRKDLLRRRKESHLDTFRKRYLHLTNRIESWKSFENDCRDFDLVISGSDQVLNPTFLLRGELNNVTPAYFLEGLPQHAKKVGYAVSFGCEEYPESAQSFASRYIQNFDLIGVRESSGLKILEKLNYQNKKSIVPDPTLLVGKSMLNQLGLSSISNRSKKICIYMLRKSLSIDKPSICIDDSKTPITLEKWIETIITSSGLITNSYHGMIMAILSETPFVVLLENSTLKGMNDRFYTLLKYLGLDDHICLSEDEDYVKRMSAPIDWKEVGQRLQQYKKMGTGFLNEALL